MMLQTHPQMRPSPKEQRKLDESKSRWNPEKQREDAERAEAERLNRAALVAVMLEHNLTIPARQFADWRPTLRVKGTISGFDHDLTIIATNGLLAWFLNESSEPWCGHVQCFSGEVKPLYSTQKDKSKPIVKKKSRRQQILDSL